MLAKIQDLRSSLKLYGALALVPFVLMGCSTATYYAVHYNVHQKILCFPKELENEGGNTGITPRNGRPSRSFIPSLPAIRPLTAKATPPFWIRISPENFSPVKVLVIRVLPQIARHRIVLGS